MANDIDYQRLGKLLGMLGSQHPGEVVNAAAAAEKLRREAGRSWLELLGSPTTSAQNTDLIAAGAKIGALEDENRELRREIARLKAQKTVSLRTYDTRQGIERALMWREHLSTWEQQFIDSVRRLRKWTGRQRDILAEINSKIDLLIADERGE